MCGIAGFWGEGTRDELERLISSIKHRGPDDTGIFHEGSVGLAHARLSIIDTSSGGHQPMTLPDGNITITFNGEIYNFQTLRDSLIKDGVKFVSTSDTEVILWLYKKKGIECFKDLIGMFAIAIYDKQKNTLILARDRMGEKPLYWTKQSNTILFASEMRALVDSGRVARELNIDAVRHYLAHDYVPTPMSIFENVFKLEPATALICSENGIEKRKFWSPPEKNNSISLDDATVHLDELLSEAVSREVLAADVPLGVFLSGGLDSSTIAYYAQKKSSRPIDTYSIGFSESSFDESKYAREIATYIGSNHHEEILSADAALDLVHDLGEVLSEPMADASVLPTMLLSRFARKSVTVALGGDGSDELFAGYPTFQADGPSRIYRSLPHSLRRLMQMAGHALPVSGGNFSFAYNLRKLLSSTSADPVQRHLEWLGSFPTSLDDLSGPALKKSGRDSVFACAQGYAKEMGDSDVGNQLLYMYARTYLMDEVLVKVDRASMRYALETRAPFLDHTIVDFVFSLPYSMKYKNGTTKYILKKLMAKKLPAHIVYRKKKGFGIPLSRWLSHELKPLCEELLSKSSLRKHQLFNQEYVDRLKNDHWEGRKDNRKELWNLMVFQLWYDRWMR